MLVGPNGVLVTASQQVACAQKLVDRDWGRDFHPQWRHTHPALMSHCLGAGGYSQLRHTQTGAGGWGQRQGCLAEPPWQGLSSPEAETDRGHA